MCILCLLEKIPPEFVFKIESFMIFRLGYIVRRYAPQGLGQRTYRTRRALAYSKGLGIENTLNYLLMGVGGWGSLSYILNISKGGLLLFT